MVVSIWHADFSVVNILKFETRIQIAFILYLQLFYSHWDPTLQ